MRIVIAPDKFKGTLTAIEAAHAIAAGVGAVHPHAEVDLCPMSDGGEGFVDTLVRACGGRFITRRVTGPLPEMKVQARFGVIDDLPSEPRTQMRGFNAGAPMAVIEMSAASGLALLEPDDHDPELTTTFGTGELLLAAMDQGCRSILLGIGGSATIDGGIGCCHAAGLPVLLEDGEPTSPTEPLCGRDLPRVVRIKSHRGEKLAGVDIAVACDVTNPLYGPRGAARVFGPQKGATPEQVEKFDQWLRRLAIRCGVDDVAQQPGAGAAGGLAFAMAAFFGATLRPGADLIIDAVGLRQRLRGADLCITGEGRIDQSSLDGKAPATVAQLCRERGVSCIAVAGSIDRAVSLPFDRTISLTDAAGERQAMQNPAAAVETAVSSALRS